MVVDEAQRGGSSDERFWRLYDEALPQVYGYLLRRSDRATAEDLTQEVFVSLARRLRAGTGDDALSVGWLMVVARSRLSDHWRTTQRAERKLRLAWSATDSDERRGLVDVDLDAAAFGPAVESALESLPPLQRCALLLHHLDGFTTAEVASSIGRSVRATESLLSRARRTFRASFEEESDG